MLHNNLTCRSCGYLNKSDLVVKYTPPAKYFLQILYHTSIYYEIITMFSVYTCTLCIIDIKMWPNCSLDDRVGEDVF